MQLKTGGGCIKHSTLCLSWLLEALCANCAWVMDLYLMYLYGLRRYIKCIKCFVGHCCELWCVFVCVVIFLPQNKDVWSELHTADRIWGSGWKIQEASSANVLTARGSGSIAVVLCLPVPCFLIVCVGIISVQIHLPAIRSVWHKSVILYWNAMYIFSPCTERCKGKPSCMCMREKKHEQTFEQTFRVCLHANSSILINCRCAVAVQLCVLQGFSALPTISKATEHSSSKVMNKKATMQK